MEPHSEIPHTGPRPASECAEVPVDALVDRRYRVRREIARGGMGVVYEAEHVVLGDIVALKVLSAEMREQWGVAERIAREARALARSRHPWIVAVRDAGQCRHFGPYVALERLEGRPLDGLLMARQRLSVASVVTIAVGLGDALTHAHRAGVIHRDIKPANVFVTRATEGQGERAVLLDFGISHLKDGPSTPKAKITRAGDVLGTPEYMAPEILIDGLEPSPESDVYALAAMLFECLAGDVPHPGNPMTIMSALLVDKPPRPLAAIRGDVPAFLETVLRRGLARDPKDRPQSPAELARMIHAAVGGSVEPLKLLEDQGGNTEATGISRRQYQRAAYVAPLRITFEGGTTDGRTEDISEGGALVVGAQGPAEGREVTLRMPLPTSGRVVTVKALARWCRTRRGAHALGIEFIDLPPDARADIARYVTLMSDAPRRDKPVGPPPLPPSAPRTPRPLEVR